LPLLDRPEREIRIEAVNAIGKLGNSQLADTLKQKLQALAIGSDETIAKAAAQAMSRLESIGATSIATPEVRAELTHTEAAKTLLVENAQVDEMVKSLDQVVKLDINTLRTGDLIENRYRYIEKIGKGAFGTVVLVDD